MADTEFLEGQKRQYSDDDLNEKQLQRVNSSLRTKSHQNIPGRISPLYNKKNNNMAILARKLGSINSKRNQFELNKISDSEEMIEDDIEDESEMLNNDYDDNISENDLKNNDDQHDLSLNNENHVENSDDDEHNAEINDEVNKINKAIIGDKRKMLINEENGRLNNFTDTSLLSSSSSLSPSLKSSTIIANTSLLKPFQSSQIGNNVNPAMAEWYKQYEDRLFNHRNAAVLAAGLHYLKPPSIASNSRLNSPSQQSQHHTQSSPINSNSQATPGSSDSSLLIERFYSNMPQSANTSSSSGNLSSSSPFSSILKSSASSSSSLNSINTDHQPEKLLAHQALLAQYAQQFYLSNGGMTPGHQNGAPFNPQMAAAMAVAAAAAHSHNGSNPNHTNFIHHGLNPESIDKERERYLASLYNQHHPNLSPFHHAPPNFPSHPQFNPHFSHQRHQSGSISPTTPMSSSSSSTNQNHLQNHINEINDRDGNRNCPSSNNSRSLRRGNSRSPSPTSSQQSGNEEEEDCDDSQSINAANGEWTYEEQFKQVNAKEFQFKMTVFV